MWQKMKAKLVSIVLLKKNNIKKYTGYEISQSKRAVEDSFPSRENHVL